MELWENKAMKKLIVLIAVILLGALANSTMAAKPSSDIKLSAGPMVRIQTCRIANHTGQAIEVFFEFCLALKDNSAPAQCFDLSPTGVVDPAPVAGILASGHYVNTKTFKTSSATTTQTCELTYSGDPGDITGMACGIVIASGPTVCVPLLAP